VFVDGYWDFPVERRGVLFAPVYVSPVARMSRTFVYAPATVIDLEVFTDHLFVRPRYRHYYFGDYYAIGYVDKGFYPWYSVQARRVGYDPIYAQSCWRHRDEPDWQRRIEVSFNRRRDNERERPPRTFDLQVSLGGDRANAAVTGFVVAKTLQQMAQSNNNRTTFRSVDRSERDVIVQRARAATKSREDRKAVELRETAATAEPVKRTTPVREKLPPASISARKDSPTSKGPAPKAPEVSKVDRSVEPKPKQKVERVTRQPATPTQPSPQPAAQPAPQPAPRPTPATRVEPKPDNKDVNKDRSPDTAKSKPPEKEKDKDQGEDDDQTRSKSKKKDKDKDD
jgi:hypothetical protein